jgi:hypothetical protein
MSGDPGGALVRALSEAFPSFAGKVMAEQLCERPWASITFAGARHRLRLMFSGPGAVGVAADFLAAMPHLEFVIPGHLVADVALLTEERCDSGAFAALELEALTIEDC